MKTQTTSTLAAANPPKYAPAKKLGAMLGVAPKTIHRWAASGRIGKCKLNRKTVLYDIAEACSLVESHRVASA